MTNQLCSKCLYNRKVLFEQEFEGVDGLETRMVCTECGGKPKVINSQIALNIEHFVREQLLANMQNVYLRTDHGLVRIAKGNYGLVATLCDNNGGKIKDFALVIEARP